MGKKVANIETSDRGSKLISEAGFTHAKQPQGKSIEAGTTDVAEHHKSNTFGGKAHTFPMPKAANASGFRHQTRSGFFRLSGDKGAHQIGKKR